MRLVGLVENENHVCCRYRLTAYRPFFERAGHQLSLFSYPANTWQWFAFLREARVADAVIVQRRLLARWRLSMLRRAARVLIYDVDDAVFQRDSYAAKGPPSSRRQRRFKEIVRTADVVVAGNHFLAENAARFGTPSQVKVIPTCVNPSHYPMAEHDNRQVVQLVWIGSASTLQGLEQARPLLENIGERVAGLELKLICDRFLEFRRLRVVPCGWAVSTEAAALAAADIGISWLPGDRWSRGKCGLKVLQYMAAGLPVVANPVGVQAEMVRHGESGFLANTADEWVEAIRRLADDGVLRRRMGQVGRRIVERSYGLEAGACRWLTLLSDLGHRRQSA